MMKKIVGTTIAIGLCAIIATATAAIIYSLTIPNNMKLATSHSLVLKRTDSTIISAYTWPDFEEGQTQIMHEVDGYVELWNTGNTAVNVTWNADCPAEWSLSIQKTFSINFNDWPSGEKVELRITEYNPVRLKILLTEGTAIADTPYSFDLKFEIV